MEEALKYWPLGVSVIAFFWGWAMWSARHSFASKTSVEALAATFAKSQTDANAAMETRVSAIEKLLIKHDERLKTVPSADDLNDMSLKIADLHGDHKTLRAEMGGVKSAVDTIGSSVTRIENYLLKTGNRA
ncbi:DUF2730 family protein [Dongia sp.]|uniref:DUF2730 family protein n=1 Tax=Dongia sp. TaxID=1977262 RepID=UPI0035AFF8D6